ncbi:MAG: aminoglycoside phosphotransferase family protein [Promethearchaeota archaeon]
MESSDVFDGVITLETTLLRGWSNINILGHSSDIDFVLKLPYTLPPHKRNYYQHLHDVSQFFAKFDITSKPLEIGSLSDRTETPFIIFEFIHGDVHNSIKDLSNLDLRHLSECLDLMSRQKPLGLETYNSPSDFLQRCHFVIQNHEGLSKCSRETSMLVESYEELFVGVQSKTGPLGSWSSTIMHGDLWVPNIVLQPDRAFLLDFESCAYGNRLYDFAYLLETPDVPLDTLVLDGLLHPAEKAEVDALRSLAISFIICWSLERLLLMESGLVEPNLNTPEAHSSVETYTRSKISRLRELIAI